MRYLCERWVRAFGGEGEEEEHPATDTMEHYDGMNGCRNSGDFSVFRNE